MSSYGQELLQRFAKQLIVGTPLVDHRPEWLHGLELDLYYPDAKVAFEFQGDQHFVPIYGRDALEKRWAYDAEKGRICLARGIALVRVDASDLEWHRLQMKIRNACSKVGFRAPLRSDPHPGALRVANRKATEYRKQLRATYGNVPSTFRRGADRVAAKRAFQTG